MNTTAIAAGFEILGFWQALGVLWWPRLSSVVYVGLSACPLDPGVVRVTPVRYELLTEIKVSVKP